MQNKLPLPKRNSAVKSHVINGVDDSLESTMGGYIDLNDDDDNLNGIPDFKENAIVAGENNLCGITAVLKIDGEFVDIIESSGKTNINKVRVDKQRSLQSEFLDMDYIPRRLLKK